MKCVSELAKVESKAGEVGLGEIFWIYFSTLTDGLPLFTQMIAKAMEDQGTIEIFREAARKLLDEGDVSSKNFGNLLTYSRTHNDNQKEGWLPIVGFAQAASKIMSEIEDAIRIHKEVLPIQNEALKTWVRKAKE